jgi:MFS family permease
VPYPQSLRALNSPDYRRYYFGQAVSMIGTWVQSVALMWLAYRLTGSAGFTGLVGFLNSIPYLVLTPVAGVLGDRLDRRRILVGVLAFLCLHSVLLALLTGFGLITPLWLGALALAAGVANAFETPTRQAFYVQLINNRDDLPNAIALNSILMNGARLVGPSLGGLIIAATNETVCFALNALSFLFVLGALRRIRPAKPPVARQSEHLLHDLAEGWRYAMGFLPVRRLLLMLAVVSITVGPYSSLMPAIAVKTFGDGAELVGFFIGCVGFGAVIAAAGMARRGSVRGLAKWIPASAVIAGAGAIGVCFSRSIPLTAAFFTLCGFGMFMTAVAANTMIQSIVDDDKRGRVMSYFAMFFIGSLPIGHLAGGYLADVIGAPRAFLVGGSLCALAGLVFAVRMKSFREPLREAYARRGVLPSDEARRQ